MFPKERSSNTFIPQLRLRPSVYGSSYGSLKASSILLHRGDKRSFTFSLWPLQCDWVYSSGFPRGTGQEVNLLNWLIEYSLSNLPMTVFTLGAWEPHSHSAHKVWGIPGGPVAFSLHRKVKEAGFYCQQQQPSRWTVIHLHAFPRTLWLWLGDSEGAQWVMAPAARYDVPWPSWWE